MGDQSDPMKGIKPVAVTRRTIMFTADDAGEVFHRLGQWWESAPEEGAVQTTDVFEFIEDGVRFTIVIEPVDRDMRVSEIGDLLSSVKAPRSRIH